LKVLEALFSPGKIALVGAAHTEEKLGGVILKNLLRYGPENIYPVNPKYKELMGVRCYPTPGDIPVPTDLVIIIRPADEVPKILREFAGKAKCAVIASAGFSEAGRVPLQEETGRTGREAGIRLLGPNCMGVYAPQKKLDTFFLPPERLARPRAGNLGVTTQSGAVLAAIFETLAESNTGISKAAHYGNAVDIDESDLYEYFARDGQTEVVISYIESVRDGRRFIEKARALAQEKPLIILKAGKGASGARAAYSHTGRLAGSYEVFSSILKQFGLKEAGDFEELMDLAKAHSYQVPKPGRGKSVLILTNGGGAGVLAADECLLQGLQVKPLPAEKMESLKALFPPFYGVGNPFDFTAQATDADYAAAFNELKDDYDGFLIIALSAVIGITEGIGKMLGSFREAGKPLLLLTGRDRLGKRIARIVESAGIPAYPTAERAVRALAALLK